MNTVTTSFNKTVRHKGNVLETKMSQQKSTKMSQRKKQVWSGVGRGMCKFKYNIMSSCSGTYV